MERGADGMGADILVEQAQVEDTRLPNFRVRRSRFDRSVLLGDKGRTMLLGIFPSLHGYDARGESIFMEG